MKQRDPDHVPSTREVMSRNGWYTVEHLMWETGECLPSTKRTLDELSLKGRVIMVRVPGSGTRLMWHRATRDTEHIAAKGEPVSLSDIPWRLKQTFLNKFKEMRMDRMSSGSVSKWTLAKMTLEQELAAMKLVNQHRRPRDGFMYPCSWIVQAPWTRHSSSTDNTYPFQIHFQGLVDARVLPHFDRLFNFNRRPLSNTEHQTTLDCVMIQNSKSVELTVYRIAHARVDAGTLRPVRCPSREDIVEQTRERLRNASKNWGALRPFIPLEGTFKLIGQAEKEDSLPNMRAEEDGQEASRRDA